MSSDTATIRVTRETRDVLAKQARAEGVSLASLLARFARERQTASVWRSEREASRADLESASARQEHADWDVTSADGLD
jgi:hypothetical protein